mmetsp:Transcript_14571/g.21463  ORF Transcript_14571/g.21463 Transcript_14571/m.21463 type:complete len:209 (+) Transcript_14571:775-1401(+)
MWLELCQVHWPSSLEHAFGTSFVREFLPNVLGHVRQKRRQSRHKSLQDGVKNCLTTPTSERVNSRNIETIFRYIQVEVGKINRGESYQFLRGSVELILICRLVHFLQRNCKTTKHPLVKRWKIVKRNSIRPFMSFRNEIVKVPNQIPCGISQFPVAIERLLDDIIPYAHITRIVDRCHPKTKNVSPVWRLDLLVVSPFDYFKRVDDIS